MKLDHGRIRDCIAELGHHVSLTKTKDGSELTVKFVVGGRTATLVHMFPDELLCLPKFCLARGHGFGKLAHVLRDKHDDSGQVCILDAASTAINTDRPELAYRDTVEKHVELLTQLIKDSDYNRKEQLREFEAHWEILCKDIKGQLNELFVAWDGEETEDLQVKPPRTVTGTGLQKMPIAMPEKLANDPRLGSVRDGAGWRERLAVEKGMAVRLNVLEPAPASHDLLTWYFRTINQVDNTGCRELKRLQKKNSRAYWLVFSASIPDGETMFAIYWRTTHPNVGKLPMLVREMETGGWMATPYRVRSLSQESLVPRAGGSLDLKRKSVLLVGCGSVGCEIALRLTSSGVGHLTISDPDKFSEENLYRHILSVKDIGRCKTKALAEMMVLKYPWANIMHWHKPLEKLRKSDELRKFDLVVIAIGSPTVERVFAEFCHRSAIAVPVINCWLEGYGIGGHAILTVPGTKGCWYCAYVDPITLARGLASGLNFLEPNQVTMHNQGGCGTQFLPYSGIAAGYTAAIAADLAVRFLEGQVTSSSRVSWKGSDTEAERASLKVTWRYRHFTESLRILPLHNTNCDFCDE